MKLDPETKLFVPVPNSRKFIDTGRNAGEWDVMETELARLQDWERTIIHAPGEAKDIAIERLRESDLLKDIIQAWKDENAKLKAEIESLKAPKFPGLVWKKTGSGWVAGGAGLDYLITEKEILYINVSDGDYSAGFAMPDIVSIEDGQRQANAHAEAIFLGLLGAGVRQ